MSIYWHIVDRILAPLSLIPLAACMSTADALRRPTTNCSSPRLDPSPDTPADIYFVTSRLADCGPPITFGRLRASEVGFGYRAGPSPVLIDRETWLDRLRRTLPADGRVLVYIHGYNTSFAAAGDRTASIRELFGGPVIAFSWPSQAKVSRYTWDEENALWTQPYFDDLIAMLLAEPRVHEIILVAHSMGNRVALRTLMEMERLHPADTALKIRNLILAAPDIDRAIFERDYRDVLVRGHRRTTVYVSRVDRPLRASWTVHGYGRVGNSGATSLTCEGGGSAAGALWSRPRRRRRRSAFRSWKRRWCGVRNWAIPTSWKVRS